MQILHGIFIIYCLASGNADCCVSELLDKLFIIKGYSRSLLGILWMINPFYSVFIAAEQIMI